MNEEQAHFVDTPWTWREKLRFRLFPSQFCPLPKAPTTWQDCIVIRTRIALSLLDRLRVLWSGQMVVETRTAAEHIVGGTMTASVAYPVLKASK